MAEEMSNKKKLHIAMFPWLAFGHMIPHLELAKLIAQRGHTVSFISTPRNIARLTPKVPSDLSGHIHFVPLALPREENLPPEAEATTDIPADKAQYLEKACDQLLEPVSKFLEASRPDWIVYDFLYWLGPVAERLGISRAFFTALQARTISYRRRDYQPGPDEPEIPRNAEFRTHEIKRMITHWTPNASGVSVTFRMESTMAGCEVIASRSCRELEAEWIDLACQIHRKPVIPVGMLPPVVSTEVDASEHDTWDTIKEWLSKAGKRSVVYVGLGTEVILSQNDTVELALGLEVSGLPFIWALRLGKGTGSVHLPDGFEERVKGRGQVWTSWVPQIRILSHESTGGYLTHCGMGSSLEGLCFGVPLIMLPFLSDQPVNARIWAEKKVGVEIDRDEDEGSFTRNSVADSLRLVVVEDEGRVYRDNASEIGKIISDRNVQDPYVDGFLDCLQKHRAALSN